MFVASLIGALFAGCGGRGSDVTIHVRPAQSLIDQPVRVGLAGLPSDRDVTLQASWRSFGGLMWRSSQRLHGGADGTATVQGMRFLWNMRPQARGLRAFKRRVRRPRDGRHAGAACRGRPRAGPRAV
jgi:hypothetical protein